LDRDAGAQAADDREEADIALVYQCVHRRLDGAPEAGGARIVEAGRHDADYGMG